MSAAATANTPAGGAAARVPGSRRRLGEMLLRAGVVTDLQLKKALEEQGTIGGLLGDTLVRQGSLSEDILVRALAKQLGLPRADLTQEVRREALALVSTDLAVQYEIVPLALKNGRTLVLATSDPLNLSMLDDVRARTGCSVEPHVAGASALRDAIRRLYRVQIESPAQSEEIRVISTAEEFASHTGPIAKSYDAPATPPPMSSPWAPEPAHDTPAYSTPQFTPTPGVPPYSGYAMMTPAYGTPVSGQQPIAWQQPYAMATPAFGLPPAYQAPGTPASAGSTRQRDAHALLTLIELLVEKGIISLDDYLARLR